MSPVHAWRTGRGISKRELLRFARQRGRFFAALVRPLVWLGIFALGFQSVLGVSIVPPYQTYVTYQVYIVPGLLGMILLFNGMQASLAMVYDREMGLMRLLLTAPLPRWYLLSVRLLATTMISLVQAYTFLIVCQLFGVEVPLLGWLRAFPAMLLAGFMLGALGLLLSSRIQQLENFAGVMNFVIFPMFFLSSALYPLWRVRETSEAMYWLCMLNPFTHGVELVRFALYGELNLLALGVVVACAAAFLAFAIWAYDPQRGLTFRRQTA
jgi:ABC-2 type transport system permease protein